MTNTDSIYRVGAAFSPTAPQLQKHLVPAVGFPSLSQQRITLICKRWLPTLAQKGYISGKVLGRCEVKLMDHLNWSRMVLNIILTFQGQGMSLEPEKAKCAYTWKLGPDQEMCGLGEDASLGDCVQVVNERAGTSNSESMVYTGRPKRVSVGVIMD